MKITFIGEVNLRSKGILFVKGVEYDLTPELVAYYTNTFTKLFEVAEEPKAKVGTEVEVEKPKRKGRTKKAVPTEE